MCGIVGFVGSSPASPRVLDGLQRLEYRGYDSAGIALVQGSRLLVYKETGRVERLRQATPAGLASTCGVGHTRWATHGGVTRANAHPHTDPSGTVAVVHNGIIDNADALRRQLIERGATFASETDTEVLAHLIGQAYSGDPLEAVREALQYVEGTWGLAVVFAGHPHRIVVARNGSPLAIGLGEGWTRVGSDARALGSGVDRVVYLEDGDVGMVGANVMEMQRLDGTVIQPRVQRLDHLFDEDDLAGHPHFMAKEILEQPTSLERALQGRVGRRGIKLAALEDLDLSSLRGLTFLACGTSFHAATVGAHVAESRTRLPCRAELASEFHHRQAVVEADRLYVAVSQSGETWDTLAALRYAQEQGGQVAGIVNVVGSSIARASGRGIYLHCGSEVAVASTKSFTSQVTVMTQLALALARARHREDRHLELALNRLPEMVERTLEWIGLGDGGRMSTLSERVLQSNYAFFMGRGPSAAVAAEGALKLRELAYVPCNSFAGGEMKHGPIAMISRGTPVIAVVPSDSHREAMLHNLSEVKARGAWVAVIHEAGDARAAQLADLSLPVARTHPALASVVSVLPLQVLAYRAALLAGCDVDKPRNLAKSVTVA